MLLRLPALEVIDQIGYRSLLLGFPFMTLGLIAGSIVAQATYGRLDFLDPKIFLVAADVGGLHGDGLYPLECGMAGTPRRVSGHRGCDRGGHRLVGELLQHDSRVRPIMKFQLIGVNHKTAPVEVRERFAIPESRLPEALKRLAGHPGVDEGMILSTCNRVEVLAQTQKRRGGPARLSPRLLPTESRRLRASPLRIPRTAMRSATCFA